MLVKIIKRARRGRSAVHHIKSTRARISASQLSRRGLAARLGPLPGRVAAGVDLIAGPRIMPKQIGAAAAGGGAGPVHQRRRGTGPYPRPVWRSTGFGYHPACTLRAPLGLQPISRTLFRSPSPAARTASFLFSLLPSSRALSLSSSFLFDGPPFAGLSSLC